VDDAENIHLAPLCHAGGESINQSINQHV